MSHARLSGQLVCKDAEEAAIVRRHSSRHVALTRAEDGCLLFELRPTEDPLVWDVEECFADAAAFHAHQARTAGSEWGTVTEGIVRRYVVEGITA